MEQSELLRYVVGALEKLGIRYFVTGSTASIFFGERRFTNDIDVVVDLDREDVPRFCAEFPSLLSFRGVTTTDLDAMVMGGPRSTSPTGAPAG